LASAVEIKVGANTKKAQRELKHLGGVFGKLDRQAKRMKAGMSSPFMAAAAGAAAAGAAVAGLTAALVKNATAVAAMGDEFARTARVLGVTNEETQQLSFLAGRARVDFSKLSSGMKRLQRNMLDSVTGNKRMAETFERLGINVQGADGKLRSVMDVSRDLADRIKAMGQGADATGTLMLLLGRAGTETADIFLQGSQAFDQADLSLRRLGGYMSEEAIAASEDYQTAVADLKTAMIGLRSNLAEGVIPALTNVTNLMSDLAPIVSDNLGEVVKDLGFDFARMLPKTLVFGLALLAANIQKITGSKIGRLREIREEMEMMETLMSGGTVGDTRPPAAGAPPASFRPPSPAGGGQPAPLSFAPVSAGDIAITKEGISLFEKYREEQRRAYMESANMRQVDSEAHQRRMAQLDEESEKRKEANEKELKRIQKEIEARQTLTNTQVGASMEALAAVETFASIGQQAVEESYFGQTKAGKSAAKALFLTGKAAALAGAIVNTALAISNALATIPPPANAAAAAGVGIAGAAQVATIAATAIQGIADAGLAPGALRNAGLNHHTVLAVRQDEMVMDPKGTSEITKMLSLQRRQLEMGVMGSANQPTEVVVEMDGRRLTRSLSPHLTRAVEDGADFRRNVRYAGAL
jgi:hypothetical protein